MGERQCAHAVGVQESVHVCGCHDSVWCGSPRRLSHNAEGHPLLKLFSEDHRVLAALRKGLVITYC